MKSCQKNENPDFSRTQMEKETIFRKLRACGGPYYGTKENSSGYYFGRRMSAVKKFIIKR